jgi:hypothetical protein
LFVITLIRSALAPVVVVPVVQLNVSCHASQRWERDQESNWQDAGRDAGGHPSDGVIGGGLL